MLRVRREGAIVIWTLARPEVRNALDAATMTDLDSAAAAAEADPTARVVVVEGEGDAFCAGGDLREARGLTGAEPTGAFSDLGYRVLGRIEGLPQAVIAAVHGAALGGGAELAMACDLRVVDTTTRLGLRHARMATVTSWGTTARLVALVGRGTTLHALLTAHDFSGDEAVRTGLAQVLAQDAKSAALELAAEIARAAPSSCLAFKRLVRAGGARDVERRLFVETWTGPEHAEAVRAHFEHRAPDWARAAGSGPEKAQGSRGGTRGST